MHLALRLKTVYMSPSHMVLPLASTTPHLTHLDLSENGFSSMPAALMGLERLQYLNLSKCPLRLRPQCFAVLMTLTKLNTLELRKEEWYQGLHRPPDSPLYAWDAESRELMDSIREKMPELDVQVGPAEGSLVM